eukprot:1156076-Pelagomonas_calceolata.AAC.1
MVQAVLELERFVHNLSSTGCSGGGKCRGHCCGSVWQQHHTLCARRPFCSPSARRRVAHGLCEGATQVCCRGKAAATPPRCAHGSTFVLPGAEVRTVYVRVPPRKVWCWGKAEAVPPRCACSTSCFQGSAWRSPVLVREYLQAFIFRTDTASATPETEAAAAADNTGQAGGDQEEGLLPEQQQQHLHLHLHQQGDEGVEQGGVALEGLPTPLQNNVYALPPPPLQPPPQQQQQQQQEEQTRSGADGQQGPRSAGPAKPSVQQPPASKQVGIGLATSRAAHMKVCRIGLATSRAAHMKVCGIGLATSRAAHIEV